MTRGRLMRGDVSNPVRGMLLAGGVLYGLLYLAGLLAIFHAVAAHAQNEACTRELHLCTDQYAPCCPGLVCNDRHRCVRDESATTSTTTTTLEGETSTTTTTLAEMAVRFVRGRDVSIRLPREDECRWWNGGTATQAERLSMYLACEARFLPEGLLYATYTPGCRYVARGQSQSNLETEDTRLRVFYTDPKRDKEWSIVSGGCPDYDHCASLGERLQYCSTRSETSRQACAASPYMTPDLLEWTDMRIEDGQCVAGADYDITIPDDEDQTLRDQGIIRFNKPLDALTPEQLALRDEILRVHHATDMALCGMGETPPAGAVKRAILAFMASATSVSQRLWFTLEFTSAIDPDYDAQTVCDLSMVAGFAMQAWGACFDLPGDTMQPCLVRTRVSHETLHRMRALHNDGLIRIGDHDDHQLTSETSRTVDGWLECFRDPDLGCRPAWLPEHWRIVMPETM